MEQAAAPQAGRRLKLADLGMALSVALAVVYGVIVWDLGRVMVEGVASQRAFAVLGLFATPLLTTWVAIAIWLASRPVWLKLTVAALLLLAPPMILFGAYNV